MSYIIGKLYIILQAKCLNLTNYKQEYNNVSTYHIPHENKPVKCIFLTTASSKKVLLSSGIHTNFVLSFVLKVTNSIC